MVQKMVKLVALATFLPRKLAFLVPQHSLSEQLAAATVRLACGLHQDPCSLRAPQGALRLL